MIEPAGGLKIESDIGVNCDGILRSRLLVYRVASTPTGMNSLVRQVQGQIDECDSSVWNPAVRLTEVLTTPNPCSDSGSDLEVGGLEVPPAFKNAGTPNTLDKISNRDSRNNILVYWTEGTTPANSRLPSDGFLLLALQPAL